MKHIPVLYRVHNLKTDEVYEAFASSASQLFNHLPRHWQDDPVRFNEVLTIEGCNIYRLKDIPKGYYFNFLSADDTPSCGKAVWVRDSYDRSAKKYMVYRFIDISVSALHHGDTRVTIDGTF